MTKTLSFILNNEMIQLEVNPNIPLLDFIRNDKHLFGTKLVCKEGDCGACTVLLGELIDNHVHYKTITSCIYPIGNCNGKHIVTIEGINQTTLIPQQHVFVEENASQCGFCTPGFIMSLTGYLLNNDVYEYQKAIKSLDGNICRCTGYESIKRAVLKLISQLSSSNDSSKLELLINEKVIPNYFSEIKEKLQELAVRTNETGLSEIIIGGGTDLFVQKADHLLTCKTNFISENSYSYIKKETNKIKIGAATTFQQFKESNVIKEFSKRLFNQLDLVASLQIRNSATIGGNIVNASPIADLVIILLTLNTKLKISNGDKTRIVELSKFYLGYKKVDLLSKEYIEEIEIEIPNIPFDFNFEKVSKRKHLDIASVNSAALFIHEKNKIISANISAGGVSPTPILLIKVSEYFKGKEFSEIDFDLIDNLIENEISPISDIRGSAEYKSLLLKRLVRAHLYELFPKKILLEELI